MSGQIWLCSLKYVRSLIPALQPLPQRAKRSMFWLEKLQKEETYRLAGYRDPGYLQCAICAITISSVSCPA